MELKTRKQWCQDLGRDYRLRADAQPRGTNENGGNVYSRDDFCLATEQVIIEPVPLTEKQLYWLEVRASSAAAKSRQQQLSDDDPWALDKLKHGE